MSSDVTARQIRAMLQERLADLVHELVPGAKARGKLYEAPNPTRGGDTPGSFKIWRVGAVGAWKEYDAGDSERGDVIDLIVYTRFGWPANRDTRGKALAWARDFLGLSQLAPAERQRVARRVDAQWQRREAENDARVKAIRRRAFETWLAAQRSLTGTLAETYLASRGIPLRDVPNPEKGELRFAPALEWWPGAEWDDARRAKRRPGPSFPAIVSALRNDVGAITGVHLTFLAPDGGGKAPVAKPKLYMADVAESVVRITRGPSNLTPEQAREQGHGGDLLVVTEGIEDALTLAMVAPEARVWCATSLSNLGNVYAGHPCVGRVLASRDNDWNKPQAVEAFEKALDRLEAWGKPVGAIASVGTKDFNDMVRDG